MNAPTQSQKKAATRRTARKGKSERTINQAAEGATGLSPLVGARSEDLADAMKTTARQLAKQPLVAAKHTLGYAGKLVDVIAGKSDYSVSKKDRRFTDESWGRKWSIQPIAAGLSRSR